MKDTIMIRDYIGLAMLLIGLLLLLMSCSGSMDHEVKGGTTNRIEIDEKFCDPLTYPTIPERRACKDAVLAAIKCRTDKP